MVNKAVLTSIAVTLAAAAAVDAPAAEGVPADHPPPFVPLGVYLSWERIGACAKAMGVERWADATMRLDALERNGVNLLWVTNMAEQDLPRLIAECGRRGLKLLPSMSVVEARVDWRWADDGAYYDNVLPRLLEAAGQSETLVGWVLSDEPAVDHFPRLETLRERFRTLDPQRFCTSVTMWPQTPQVPLQTKLPVVCVDLYPFFGPNDPNGPHTDAASRSFFRRNALKMIDAIGDRPAVGWVMGMCFSDIWGPRKYDDSWHLIGLPGSYLHWRCPTGAEMRWQVWETFRAGAKGYVCYTLAPEAPDPENASLPAPDVKWTDVLAKEATDLGPNALTNPDGTDTPQLRELGALYQLLAPRTPLIRSWQRSAEPLLEVAAPGNVQVFRDPRTDKRYALVLNDDLQATQAVTIRVGEHTSAVSDVFTEQPIVLTRDFAGGSGTGTVELASGDGTILELTIR